MNPSPPKRPSQAPDAEGWARKLLGRFHVTGVFWFRFHCWGMSILPEWGVWVVIQVFTAFFFVALRKIRRAIAGNLQAVLGSCGWFERQRRIWRTMSTFAWCLSERYESMVTERRFQIEIDGVGRWDEVVRSGVGFIIVTAHVGHWEIGSRLPIEHGARRIHVVRERELDPRAQEFIQDLMSRSSGGGYDVIFADADDPNLGPFLLHALREGDLVALQGDRPRAGGRIQRCRLFDRPFDLPVGPAALARAARVPLVPIFILREKRCRARVYVRPPISIDRSDDKKRDLHQGLQSVADEIAWAIQKEPHQWFCFRELWPPAGSA